MNNNIFLQALVLLSLLLNTTWLCYGKKLPASFVFGDSLVDAGNNNYIVSLSKANYLPNGIDFGGPTGRYTNGRTIVDILGQELGLEDLTPPYLAPTTTGSLILKGVNYASGGGGILVDTGKIFVGRINLDTQLDNFANTRRDIFSSIGEVAAQELFRQALFSLTIGSNDLINNYFTPSQQQNRVPPPQFVSLMISTLRQQLTRLYDLGARKIITVNVGPIGCIPYQRDMNPDAGDECVSLPNQMAQMFNGELKTLVADLSKTLPASTFVYADVYKIFSEIIQNHTTYGFGYEKRACCYVAGRFGGLVPCGPTSKVCGERSEYVFWDPYHPSDAANVIIARRLLDGGVVDISPINVRKLADL